MEDAARAIAFASMQHSGQVCMSTERVIVQRGVSKQLIEALTRLFSILKAGDISDPAVQLSCLFNDNHAENVVSMIKEAKDMGAEVLVGNMSNEGALLQPHLLLGVKPGMQAWERESFGPSKAGILSIRLLY